MVFQKTINRLTKMVWHKRRGKNMEKEIRHPTREECEATIRRITGKKETANLNPGNKPICGSAMIRVVMKRRYPGDGYSPDYPSVELNNIPARTAEDYELLKKLVLSGIPKEEEEMEEESIESLMTNNRPQY